MDGRCIQWRTHYLLLGRHRSLRLLWVYPRIPLNEIDYSNHVVLSSVLHGTLVQPQYAGEISVKALGIDADIYNEQGKSCKPGESGELVIKSPFPNAAIYIWNDHDGSRYRSSYFESHPGVWTHGDFAKVNPATQGIIMLGRR